MASGSAVRTLRVKAQNAHKHLEQSLSDSKGFSVKRTMSLKELSKDIIFLFLLEELTVEQYLFVADKAHRNITCCWWSLP